MTHQITTRKQAIEDLFGEDVTEEEARAMIHFAQVGLTSLDPVKLRAGAPLARTQRTVLADAHDHVSKHWPGRGKV
jgi:hypothetical protein